MTAVFLNGKFTAQRVTGVQRVARQLAQALDDQFDSPRPDWVLLCPAAATDVPPLWRITVRRIGPPRLPLHLWEQVVLPRAARGGLLVNLAGAAPFAARRQLCLLHDAAVFDHAGAYTRAFVAWYRTLFRRLARRPSTRLLTVSAFSRARLALHLGLAPDALAVVPNGCDHLHAVVPDAGVLTAHRLTGLRYLLAVGSQSAHKNLDALLTAYAGLPPDPLRRLVVVGGGNARVFAASTRPADPDGVIRLGPVSDAQLKALYQHATALVFPSLYEGFGLPPLEAMACGCAVAAAGAAAIDEVCGEAALYFDPRSPADIAAAMRRLLDDAPLRERLRAAGLARAAAFTWQRSARLLRQQIDDAGIDASRA